MRDYDLIDNLTGLLYKVRVDQITPQAVSNIAWSCSVLEVQDASTLAWVWRTLDRHIGDMEVTGLSQVHQFLLHCRLEGITKHDVLCAFYDQARFGPKP